MDPVTRLEKRIDEVRIVPDTLAMTLWRSLLSMTYMHPSLLIHPDMAGLRQFFIEQNVIHEPATMGIFIPYPVSHKSFWARPCTLHYNSVFNILYNQRAERFLKTS